MTIELFGVALGGYLLGAIPTAYLAARAQGVDIFAVGSGNPGATNVARALGRRWGIAVWLLDGCKGIGAVLLGHLLLPTAVDAGRVVGALAAICGHNWSLYLLLITRRLRGGKGASTAFGTLLVIAPPLVFWTLSAFGLLIIWRTRYVSLASVTIFAVSAAWLLLLCAQALLPPVYIIYALGLIVLILPRFRGNIARLLAGTERQV